jgi:WhiB family redox-sensing transcriptional regulator
MRTRAADAFGRLASDGGRGRGADWRDGAPCTQTDPEAFFPDQGTTTAISRQVTKRMCRECRVSPECLGFALTIEPAPAGIWGGTTSRERGRLRRGPQE